MTKTSRLTVFAFLWACQSLIHQEFYSNWVNTDNPLGYMTTIFGVALLLRPSSVKLLAALALSSACYNIGLWPHVKNHILVETLMNLVIFTGIVWSWSRDREPSAFSSFERHERVFERFAPVLMTMMVIMYYFAVLAKFNSDFLDPNVSCVTKMYHEDLLRRFPFFPSGAWVDQVSIWATMVIELAIPVFFTFRRTRLLAIAIGLIFHLMLGIIEHRTFSGLAYALYGLFLINPLTARIDLWRARWWDGRDEAHKKVLARVAAAAVVVLVAGMVLADRTGYYQTSKSVLQPYRLAWVLWGVWMLVVMAVYGRVMMDHARGELGYDIPERTRPGVPKLLWLMLPLVFLNGMCQYLGLKTQTSFTMYSNLRTENYRNNHLFMPNWRLLDHQDDLVDIVATDHPELLRIKEQEQFLPYFELRRITSETNQDFDLTYFRNGKTYEFRRRDGAGNDEELMTRHPLLVAKLLFYRAVDKGDQMTCRH